MPGETMKTAAKVMDEEAMRRAMVRISHEIIECSKGAGELAIVGIWTRGAYLGRRIAGHIREIDGTDVPVGVMDITLYRDDLTAIASQPVIGKTEIDFDITEKRIILVDDVLYTGRTVRCALDEVIDFGRPKVIQLVALVDRGHRELPIRADYVGKNMPTAENEVVRVRLKEVDGVDEVVLEKR